MSKGSYGPIGERVRYPGRGKGRVVKMAAGETYGATLVVEVQDSVRGVDAVEEEIDAIQESGQRVVHGEPISEYSEV